MIRFIVDSTLGVSGDYAKEHNIKIVNLKLVLDGIVSDEGFEPQWEEFYSRFKASDKFPSTSQPNPESFINAINEIYSEDAEAEIIIITISGNLSGTVNSARLAKDAFKNKRIAVIDSQNAAAASLIILEELMAFIKSGKTFDEAVLYTDTLINKASIKFIPDTMKYLKRGGRIGTLGALFASIISVKPIFEYKKSVVTIPCKILGFSKAATEMIKRLPKKIKRLIVCFIGDKKNVPLVVQKVQNMLGINAPEVKAISPVFGIHVGLGAVGIACLEG